MAYKNVSRPVKFRGSQKCAKMLMIFACEFRRVLTAYRVPTGETVNKEYYKIYIRTILRPAVKRQEMTDRTPLILNDNASPHKANVFKELLKSYQWEVLAEEIEFCHPVQGRLL